MGTTAFLKVWDYGLILTSACPAAYREPGVQWALGSCGLAGFYLFLLVGIHVFMSTPNPQLTGGGRKGRPQ